MGCIEIRNRIGREHKDIRLIETWDVLKLQKSKSENAGTLFNRNMGCIEMIFLYRIRGS